MTMFFDARRLTTIFACTTLLISFFSSAAMPSQAQIEQFKQLPKAQQNALAKQYGVDLSALTSTKTNATSQPAPTLDQLVSPRDKTEVPAKIEATVAEADKAITSQFDNKKSKATLRPFGYDLFSGQPSTFAPVSDVPVPNEYVLGPGDTLRVLLYGKESQDLSLTINRRGEIEIPNVGPLNIAGQSFIEAKSIIKDIIQEKMIGAKTSISMGEMRSVRIFVLGDAFKPGSYTLSSLSTVTQALYAAGGVNSIGSLRNIQVKRRGKTLTTFDLYDLLLKGDTSNDIHLLAGDVVFIPPVTKSVGIKGEVARPAIYELKNESSLQEILAIAGGMLATAYEKIVKVERINDSGLRSVLNIDLNTRGNAQQKLQNGDILEVGSVLTRLEHSVTIKGHVARPGIYGWHKNMRLSELLGNINDFKERPELNYILVIRKNAISDEISSFAVNYAGYIKNGDNQSDFSLNSQDTVYVFNKNNDRAASLKPVLEKIRKQVELAEPANIVSIMGSVRNPGSYPLTQKAEVATLLQASMGYSLNAELSFAILARFNIVNFQTEVHYLDLTNSEDQHLILQPLDRLFVFDKKSARANLLENLNEQLQTQATKNLPQKVVNINGDVRFPGQYPLAVNMSTDQLIALAGGLNESTYLIDAELTRFSSDGVESASISHQIVNIQNNDLVLKPLDTLQLKRIPDWREKRTVKLVGEFTFPGTYVLNKGETLSDVIVRAGGLTEEADSHASIFTREEIKQQQQRQINRLRKDLKSQITLQNLDKEAGDLSVDSNEINMLAERLDDVDVVGRIVIDLPGILANNTQANIRLDANDALYIPKKRESIMVLGEVLQPTTHIYSDTVDWQEYIDRSGGVKSRADIQRIYLIKADGSIINTAKNNNWFSSNSDKLSAGDTIIVPLDIEFKDNLSLWTQVTQILYQTGVAVAAISAL